MTLCPSARRCRPSRVTVPIAVIVALVAAGCGSSPTEHAAAERVIPDGEMGAPIAASISSASLVVARPSAGDPPTPEPTVAPGTCETVVYTPPTASSARTGEVCVPTESTGDVVVLVHGGGGFEGDPADTAVWRDAHLAAGRTTFTIEYALLDPSTDSEALWPLPEQNLKAAVQWVRGDGTVLSGVLALQGFSAGARLAGIVATTAGDEAFAGDELWPDVDDGVDAAILLYGYFDGSQFHADQYYGSASPEEAIALGAADSGDPPVLVVHGTADVIVPVAQSREFAAAVEAAGGSATLMMLEGRHHGFDGYGQAELTADGVIAARDVDAWLSTLETLRV